MKEHDMLRKFAVMAMAALLLSGAATLAAAQTGGGGGPMKLYNPQTVELLTGQIERMERLTPKRANAPQWLGFILKTDKESILVLLGPSRFIDKMAFKPAAGDLVTVKGSRVTFQNRPLILAAEVRKGTQVLQLRDDAGRPIPPRPRRPAGTGMKTAPGSAGPPPAATPAPAPAPATGTETAPGPDPLK
jgi:hypothetical protein